MPLSLRRAANALLALAPLRRIADSLADGLLYQPLILFFHGVEKHLIDERLQVLHTTLTEFEPLMHHLKREFDLIDCDELKNRMSAKKPDLRRCVLLTFDDGYANNATLVSPLLKSLDIPFTVYLTTSAVGTRSFIPTFVARAALSLSEHTSCSLPGIDGTVSLADERQRARAVSLVSHFLKTCPAAQGNELTAALRALLTDSQWSEIEEKFHSDRFMTWDQVIAMKASGACIASHGHEHYPLHQYQSREEIRRQLVTSRDLISQHVGPCHHYAFPNGQPADICPAALAELSRAGYATATTTVPGSITADGSLLLLPRSCIYSVEALHRRVLRTRFDGSRRFLRHWQKTMLAAV